MANAVWPLGDEVVVQGYEETPPENKIRTQMDQGPAKQRRRSTAGSRPLRFAVSLSVNEVETLDDFHETTLAAGTLPFDWRHPRTKAAATFRFVGPPRYRPGGGARWFADLDLEIQP